MRLHGVGRENTHTQIHHTYIYTYIHTKTHTYINTYIHIHKTYTNTYIHTYTHIHKTYTNTYVYTQIYIHTCIHTYIYKVSQEECARLREGVPYVKVYRYNLKHLCPKLNGYGDNGQGKV